MARPTGLDEAGSALEQMAADGESSGEKSLDMSQYAKLWLAGAEGAGSTALTEPLKPFQQSLWVYRCVKKIMDTAAGIPLRLMTEGAGVKVNRKTFALKVQPRERGDARALRPFTGRKAVLVGRAPTDQTVEGGEAYDLLEAPNGYQTWPAFFGATIGYLVLRGKAAWVLADLTGRRPREMHVVDGRTITPVWAKASRGRGPAPFLVGYLYQEPGTGQQTPLSVEEVKYFALWDDTDDPLGGMSPIKPGRLAIATDYSASLYNAAMFSNGCDPGMVIEFEEMPTGDKLEEFRLQLLQRHAGPAKAKRPLILGGTKEVKSFPTSMADLQFMEGKGTTRVELCCLFDVPPTVAGFLDAAGDSSAYTSNSLKQFYETNIFPLLDGFVPALQEIVSRFDGRLVAWFDVEDQPLVQEMRLSRIAHAKGLFALGYPPNAINAMLDLGMPETPWGDVGLLPVQLMPASDVVAGNVVPAQDEGPSGEGGDELDQNAAMRSSDLPAGRQGGGVGGEQQHSAPTGGFDDAETKALADKVWQVWMRSWAPLAKRFSGLLRSRYQIQQTAAIAALRRLVQAREAKTDATKDDAIIGRVLLEVFGRDSAAKFRGSVKAALADAGELGIRQALVEAGFEGERLATMVQGLLSNPAITSALASDSVRVSTLIDGYTRKVLKRSLGEGMTNGEGIRRLADRVQDLMGNRRTAALTTAKNAVGQTLSRARHESHLAAGMTHKTWLHSRSAGEWRPAHVAAEGHYRKNPIPLAEPFVINGIQLMYPRDHSAGAPQETVNCQCLQLAKRARRQRDASGGEGGRADEPGQVDPFGRADLTVVLARGFVGYGEMLLTRGAPGQSDQGHGPPDVPAGQAGRTGRRDEGS